MQENQYFYLTAEEIQHYKYMLAHKYPCKIIEIASQKYLIFMIIGKPDTGIAWPTVTGFIDGVSSDVDIIFEMRQSIQDILMPHLTKSTIKGLLFPKYAD